MIEHGLVVCLDPVGVNSLTPYLWKEQYAYLSRPVQSHVFANPENTAWVKNTVHKDRC
jgi:hypothetical protein